MVMGRDLTLGGFTPINLMFKRLLREIAKMEIVGFNPESGVQRLCHGAWGPASLRRIIR